MVVRTTELTSATRTRPFLPRPISLTIFQLRFTRRGLAAAPQAGKLAASPTHKQNAGAQFRKPAVHFFGCFSEPALVNRTLAAERTERTRLHPAERALEVARAHKAHR